MSLLDCRVSNIAALRAAVAEARSVADEFSDEDNWEGLSATRQVFGEEDFVWHVSFGLADFMTHISHSDMRDKSDDELADEIWLCWDPGWDAVQVESPVGDFRVGSSDFEPRREKYWFEE